MADKDETKNHEDPDVDEKEFAKFSRGGGMSADIDQLITKFRVKIDRLRERVADFVPADDPQYDDVFYLRYVLSYKAKTTKCVEPIRFTVNYRRDNAELLERIHREGANAVPHHPVAMRFNCTGMCGTLPSGGPIFVVRTAHSMQSQLMSSLTTEEVAEWLLLSKEIQWHICDQRTRETRKLTKMISVVDLQGFSLGGSDRRFFKALGDSSKASAKCYPQLLGKSVIMNPPSFFGWMFKAFSVFQPKSAREKTALCKVKGSANKSAADCPWLTNLNGVNCVPPFLGGTGPLPKELEVFDGRDDALAKLNVKARSAAETIEVSVPKGGIVTWEVILKAHGINVRFQYRTLADPTPKTLDVPGAEDGVLKIQATQGLTSGKIEIPEDGTLMITFDNTHSYFRSKSLQYRTAIDIPDAALVEGGAEPTIPDDYGGGEEAPELPEASSE